jgi:hypothetical protein
MRCIVIVALHAVYQFRAEAPLHLSPTQCAGYPGTMLPVRGIGRAYAKFLYIWSTLFTSAFLKFPTIHNRPPARFSFLYIQVSSSFGQSIGQYLFRTASVQDSICSVWVDRRVQTDLRQFVSLNVHSRNRGGRLRRGARYEETARRVFYEGCGKSPLNGDCEERSIWMRQR